MTLLDCTRRLMTRASAVPRLRYLAANGPWLYRWLHRAFLFGGAATGGVSASSRATLVKRSRIRYCRASRVADIARAAASVRTQDVGDILPRLLAYYRDGQTRPGGQRNEERRLYGRGRGGASAET